MRAAQDQGAAGAAMAARQRTIGREERFTGIALHGGGEVSVRLLPAPANTGIVFRRVRRDNGDVIGEVRASADAVCDTHLATTLQDGAARVGMVEHVLSALAANDLDNIVIELDGDEVPILDGSAAPWMLFFEGCGAVAQEAAKRYIRINRPVRVEGEGGGWAEFLPAEESGESAYHISIDYPHKVVAGSGQEFSFTLSRARYAAQVARARTFCYVGDVEMMHRYRRALGGSLQNAVVYDDDGVINPGGLRYANEFARHKMLDVIGDCYINGARVLGQYRANKPGHGLNNRLMREVGAGG